MSLIRVFCKIPFPIVLTSLIFVFYLEDFQIGLRLILSDIDLNISLIFILNRINFLRISCCCQ